MFSTTYTQAEVEEFLMRPVRITALMNELTALQRANVISHATGSDVANLIFDEIQTATLPMRTDWQTLIDSVKDYSRHLYQTTDELNEMMSTSVNPSSDMATYRIQVDRINDVYDSIKAGFDLAVSMDTDKRNLSIDFFSPTALYKVDYESNYANIAGVHTANTISAITTRIFESDSLYNEQKTKLTDLRNSFPEIAVESFDSSKYKEAVYLPNSVYVKLLPENLFRIYNDASLSTDIGSIFGEETLIAKREETYTFTVVTADPPQDTSRRFMIINHLKGTYPSNPVTEHFVVPTYTAVPTANAVYVAQGSSVAVKGSDIKSLAFEGPAALAGTPQFGNANTTSGKDSVIRYTDLS